LNVCLNAPHHRDALTKTITIRDKVYRKLLTVKRRDESFSQLFERLTDDVSAPELLRKLRGCVEFRDKNEMLSEIRTHRVERRLL